MQHRPLESPQFKKEINQRTTPLNSARLLPRTAPLQRDDISVKRIWVAQKWLDKTGKRVSQHKRANHGFFGSTNAHFMSKYRKEKKQQKKNTCSDCQRQFCNQENKSGMWEGLGFVCPGAEKGPLGLYLLQSQNRWGVLAALTALGQLT